ncbi:septum formation initiator family protein [Proteiniclasticum sp. BAD-10]|uniref:Septum formation initiator family protein n=1 Tax=Proteiniclasticum sediminis TaxID=2804028 RepID=A0A941CRE6_9CLOT|nr:septum formation initiator family protein [Proteiniclasticum sediminis]MBR0576398.1 septum formation initiator family protein [Proteiniclasticum sediminis]
MKMGKLLRRIVLLAFAGIMALTIYNQEVMMANIRKNISRQEEVLADVRKENEKLKNLVDSTKTEEYTIRNARTRLGLLRPGEVPVIDTSGN